MRATTLRQLLAGGKPLLLPGVYDALSARVAERSGFSAAYLSGSAVAMALVGLPDIGLITATEMADQLRRVAESTNLPVICDADTGYGNAVNVARTVRMLEAAGACGVQLEDQTFPKRCGHFEGKEVIARDEMVAKIQAALETRRTPDLLVIARTDALAVDGLEAAIDRATAYHEAGADIIFVEAPRSVEELRIVGKRIPGPLLVNVVEGGATPELPFEAYVALGFQVILYPTAAVRVSAKALATFYDHLQRARSTADILPTMVSFDERNEINDLATYLRLERRYASRTVPSESDAE